MGYDTRCNSSPGPSVIVRYAIWFEPNAECHTGLDRLIAPSETSDAEIS